MYKKNTHSWLKHWDFMLADLVYMEVSFWAAVLIRNGFSEELRFPVYMHASIALLFLNICVVFFIQSYKNILKRDGWEELYSTFIHVTCIVAAMLVYIYMLQETYDYSRIVYALFWLLYLLTSLGGRSLLKGHLQKKKKANKGSRSLLAVAWCENAETVVTRLHEMSAGDIRLVGVALMDSGGKAEDAGLEDGVPTDRCPAEVAGFPVVASGENVLRYIKENWVDEVFLCTPPDVKAPQGLMDACAEMGITTHLKIADTAGFGMNRVVEKMGGYTVLTQSLRMATPFQALQKRLMDILGGLVGIVLTGIAFLFVAPAIWIRSPGPVFFSQVRVGKNGKLFRIYKFRSMYLDAEERKKELMAQNKVKDGMMFKIEDDPRIIKGIGSFIRKTSIDELPQFWNVLKGDMSIVGTRPPTTDEWEKYELHHRRRLAVKPGITGMWQVSGRSNISDFEEVVRLDTQYIQEWSLLLDIRIILKTLKVVVKREGSA